MCESWQLSLSAFAEDHGREPRDECDGRTLRSSKSEGGCFGGFRRRKEGYHGCKPVEASFLKILRRDKAAAQGILADGTGLEKLNEIIWTAGL